MTAAPPVLVTGPGHSGTGYLAHVLAAAGLLAGHEAWWNPHGTQTPGLDVDVSWLGALGLGAYDGTVFLQTRRPLLTIASIAAHLADPAGAEPYAAARYALTPATGHPVADAARSYLDCTIGAARRAAAVWHVERVTPAHVALVAAAAGRSVSPWHAADAVAATPATLNGHGDYPPVTLDDVAAAGGDSLAAGVATLATALGYPEP